MQPIPYVFFKSGCREAVETYGRIFGSAPEIMSISDAPPEARAAMGGAPDDAVMHAAVRIGDGWLYASDDPSGGNSGMAGSSVSLSFPSGEETRRVWDALADGGEVRAALSETFWTPLFGMLTDRFGTVWMIMQDAPEG